MRINHYIYLNMPSPDSVIVSDSFKNLQQKHSILNWIADKQVEISAIHVISAKIIVNIDESQGIFGLLKRRVL